MTREQMPTNPALRFANRMAQRSQERFNNSEPLKAVGYFGTALVTGIAGSLLSGLQSVAEAYKAGQRG